MLLGLILILITIAGCGLFAFKPAWFPAPVSPEAFSFDVQFSRTLWITGIIFICAQLILAWVVFRGRRKRTALAGGRRLEVALVAVIATLFLTLAGLGSRTWAKVPDRAAGKEVIEVYAYQFHWNFRYPGPDGLFGHTANQFISDSGGNPFGINPADPTGKDDIVAARLRIPVGRDVLLLLHSRDVIHDFFVRELRTKQDIVPGMEIPLQIHVDVPGEYEIACAELCGLGHSQMRSVLIAMQPLDYDLWKTLGGLGP